MLSNRSTCVCNIGFAGNGKTCAPDSTCGAALQAIEVLVPQHTALSQATATNPQPYSVDARRFGYFNTSTIVSWQGAEKVCQSIGSSWHLASFHSNLQESWVYHSLRNQIPPEKYDSPIFIGLSRGEQGADWSWVDDSEVDWRDPNLRDGRQGIVSVAQAVMSSSISYW